MGFRNDMIHHAPPEQRGGTDRKAQSRKSVALCHTEEWVDIPSPSHGQKRTADGALGNAEGRLQDSTLELLRGSDIQFKREHRLDIALVKNLPIALVFLPAADIPTFVGQGKVDLGITGRDQVAERDTHPSSTDQPGWEEVLDLEFGVCKLQVQVPEKGDISDVQQLVGKHVATSFVHLAEAFFSTLERDDVEDTSMEGIVSEKKLRTRITQLGGSVETACALGVADGIVDLVGEAHTERKTNMVTRPSLFG